MCLSRVTVFFYLLRVYLTWHVLYLGLFCVFLRLQGLDYTELKFSL